MKSNQQWNPSWIDYEIWSALCGSPFQGPQPWSFGDALGAGCELELPQASTGSWCQLWKLSAVKKISDWETTTSSWTTMVWKELFGRQNRVVRKLMSSVFWFATYDILWPWKGFGSWSTMDLFITNPKARRIARTAGSIKFWIPCCTMGDPMGTFAKVCLKVCKCPIGAVRKFKEGQQCKRFWWARGLTKVPLLPPAEVRTQLSFCKHYHWYHPIYHVPSDLNQINLFHVWLRLLCIVFEHAKDCKTSFDFNALSSVQHGLDICLCHFSAPQTPSKTSSPSAASEQLC